MAVVITPCPIIRRHWTKRDGKMAVRTGGHMCFGTGLDHTSGYVLSVGSISVRLIDLGKPSLTSYWSNGVAGRKACVLKGRRNKKVENDKSWRCGGSSGGSRSEEDDLDDGIERKNLEDLMLSLDGQIPTTSDGFLKQISSDGYDLRRQLEQNIESSSYDVLDVNPWRETPKAVYVLAQEEDRLWTMRTRRSRSEVEEELGMLFPKQGSSRGRHIRSSSKARDDDSNVASSGPDIGIRVLVEDIREGVLKSGCDGQVFEDEEDATRYCSLLDGQGKYCAGVAKLDASDIFAVCQKTQTLAVLFRRGTTPPQPDRLQLNLKARKRSLEDET